MIINNSYSFLAIGKTQESTESQSFERYIGVGSSFVIGVNPTKKELEEIYGREIANEPEYVVETDNGKEAHVTFVVKTDPKSCNGIAIINRIMFTLRNAPAYNRDQTRVQVIDQYGNTTWADVEAAKEGRKLFSKDGKELKIDSKYRMACVGEADLIGFLKPYLGVEDVFNYVNSTWVKKENADEYLFSLEHIKEYFKGDVSELKEAIALQPNNKVKLLYGIHTTDEGKQYQTVATRNGLILPNKAGSKALEKVEKELKRIKQNGGYANTEFIVRELAKFTAEPTDLSSPANTSMGSEDAMPWE